MGKSKKITNKKYIKFLRNEIFWGQETCEQWYQVLRITYISICINIYIYLYVNKICIIKCVYKMCIYKMYNCSTIGLGERKIIVRKT